MVIKDNVHLKKDTIMFDIDGTLIRFDTIEESARVALSEYGYGGKEYQINHQLGVRNLIEKSRVNRNYFNLENHVIEQHMSMGLSIGDTRDLVDKMLELAPKYAKLHNGVAETLRTLKQDLICVSDWFAKEQLEKLTKVGIEHYFRMLYTCEGQYAKPNKKRFLYILKEEGLKAKDCIMVGDSSNDLGALSVGIDTILVDYNQNRSNLYERSTAVITEFSDLQKILRR
jgi:HAD superfamily hydrolase (TIGR01509 family)